MRPRKKLRSLYGANPLPPGRRMHLRLFQEKTSFAIAKGCKYFWFAPLPKEGGHLKKLFQCYMQMKIANLATGRLPEVKVGLEATFMRLFQGKS